MVVLSATLIISVGEGFFLGCFPYEHNQLASAGVSDAMEKQVMGE